MLLFADSFDHYSTAQVTRKWSATGNGQDLGAINSSAGRNTTSGWRNAFSSSASGGLQIAVPSNPATLVAGYAFYVGSLPAASRFLFGFSESGTLHTYFILRTDGKIEAYREGTPTLLGTSSGAIAASQYNYLEFKSTIHDSTGVITAKVNGVTQINLSSQDTRNGGSGVITNAHFNGVVGTARATANNIADIDDAYLVDTTGSTNTDFLGDVRVQAIFPTGAGNYTQWTPSAGSNFQNVDENPATDDTDYNSSATVAQKDSFVCGDVTPTTGTVYGVCVNLVTRKDDAGTRSIRSLVRLSATDANATAQTIGTSYANYQFIHETKPGGGAFSISDVNNSEYGYEITA